MLARSSTGIARIATQCRCSRFIARNDKSTISKRRITTAGSAEPAKPMTLLTPSAYIRPLTASQLSSDSSGSGSSSSSSSSASSSSSSGLSAGVQPDDFLFWPNFFDATESHALLEMALWKLDRVDGTRKRRRRSRGVAPSPDAAAAAAAAEGKEEERGLQRLFEGEYGFEEGHYDSVIHHYRETLLSSLPPTPSPTLVRAMTRLYALLPQSHVLGDNRAHVEQVQQVDQASLPPKGTLTHLLHLAPQGEILPHVDNLDASGSVIIGVSLGSERVLRLVEKRAEGEREQDAGQGIGRGWDVRLPSGSVYLQRDSIRYGYEHAILPYSGAGAEWDGQSLDPGHRLSIMIRVSRRSILDSLIS